MAVLTYAQLVAKKDLIIVSGTQYGITAEQLNDLFLDICDSVVFFDSSGNSLIIDDVDADEYKVGGVKVVGSQGAAIPGCVSPTTTISDAVAKTAINELRERVYDLINALTAHGLIAAPEE